MGICGLGKKMRWWGMNIPPEPQMAIGGGHHFMELQLCCRQLLQVKGTK